MPAPFGPNKWRELIPSLDGDFCEKFIGSLNSPALFSAWYKSVFLDDGTLTDEFKAMVCEGTAGTGGDPTTPPTEPPVVTPPVEPPPTQPPAPLPSVVLIASRGTFPTVVRLNWTPSVGATVYQIYRLGTLYATVPFTQRIFDDLVPPGSAFVYTVQALNTSTGAVSPQSNPAYGYTRPIFGGSPPIP